MNDFIQLKEVVYDARARNGTWCKAPYYDHPHGCPNYPECPSEYQDFCNISPHDWFAVIEEFDLATHAENMKQKHPDWTERQCRNLLYWQNTVRKRLKAKALIFKQVDDILLEIPEACGINVFATLSNVGIILQRQKPNYIVKTMFIGRPMTVRS